MKYLSVKQWFCTPVSQSFHNWLLPKKKNFFFAVLLYCELPVFPSKSCAKSLKGAQGIWVLEAKYAGSQFLLNRKQQERGITFYPFFICIPLCLYSSSSLQLSETFAIFSPHITGYFVYSCHWRYSHMLEPFWLHQGQNIYRMDVELELKTLCQHSSVEQFCFAPIIFIQLNRELYFSHCWLVENFW